MIRKSSLANAGQRGIRGAGWQPAGQCASLATNHPQMLYPWADQRLSRRAGLMASIDQVIARSRQPGGFSEKKRFSVARQRGIRKMREFALADPHYYVLELIQAAVANAAENVDIRVEKSEFGLSYIGGGFTQEELAQLFDFLFASKKDFEHGDIRQLALGVNALMIFEPDSIVVESGDGTLAGTTRIAIRGRDETVDVGTPQDALRGTFIRAEGLKRSAVRGKSNLESTDYGPPETRAIEERCLAAPVPIIVNTEPVFGYSTVRTPSVFGYFDVVGFDEGDLYGTIGRARHAHKRFFKVMTWGVWISSLEHELMDGGTLGGVVNYDRLNKTADHSGIVQDETLAELWARLLPYARRSKRGDTGKAVFEIRPLGGEAMPPRDLRELMRESGRVVVMPGDLETGSDRAVRASELGELLDARVLCVAESDVEALENLAGSAVRIIRPVLDDQRELNFFRQETADPPPRPWLCGVEEVELMTTSQLRDALFAEEHTDQLAAVGATMDEVLGRTGSVRSAIYTPDDKGDGAHRQLWVRILTMERLVWEGPVSSSFPGHVVDVEVPAVSPMGLLDVLPGNEELTMAEAIAEVAARHLLDELAATANRAIRALNHTDVRPGSVAARVALAAIGRHALLRLRQRDGADELRLSVSMIEQPPEVDLLELDLLETLGGDALSVGDLCSIMHGQRGLLYGVVPDVKPELSGLNREHILALDLESERLLVDIVGPAAYVRIDRRDLLATADGINLRNVAAGLRDRQPGDLLLEADVRARRDELPEATVRELVSELVRVALTRPGDSEHSSRLRLQRLAGDKLDLDPHAEPPEGALEHRRQALMHLQYFVFRRWQYNRTYPEQTRPTYGVEMLRLFVGDNGNLVSFEDLQAALRRHGRLVMLDGRGIDAFAFGKDIAQLDDDRERPCKGLAMNPWLLSLLGESVDIEPAFDFALTDDEARAWSETPERAYLFEEAVDAPGITGRIGISPEQSGREIVAVVESGHAQVHPLRRHSEVYGVIGFVRVESGHVDERWSDVNGAVERAARTVIKRMIEELPSTDPDSEGYDRMLDVLFAYASRYVEMERMPNGRVTARTTQPLPALVLDLPLFPTASGTPVSAQRLIHEFCLRQTRGADMRGAEVVEDAVPARLRAWMDAFLSSDRIDERPHRSASVDGDEPRVDGPFDKMSDQALVDVLTHWLSRLRPVAPSTPGEEGGEARAANLWIGLVDPDERESILALSDEAARRLARSMESDAPFAYTSRATPMLLINSANWVWREFKTGARTPNERLAWMLLSIYAFINELLELVTNDQELTFQQRVAEALMDGTLSTNDRI